MSNLGPFSEAERAAIIAALEAAVAAAPDDSDVEAKLLADFSHPIDAD